MKSNVPWSIKGINPEARAVAKEAARNAGMTLGEWLNKQIIELGSENPEQAGTEDQGENVTQLPTNVVTVDQLREVVYSLNRLNDRLKSSEETNLKAFSGLNEGLTSVLDRVRRVEDERRDGPDPELLTRLETVEQESDSRKYIDSFAALEKALQHMVQDFETTRTQTLARVDAHEEAIKTLDARLHESNSKDTAALNQLRQHVELVADQLRKTEATSRALMMEAKAAAQSSDEEFIERTSNKLRILGTEIKRSGDQIQDLETNIQKLSDKIEGAEQRSAEGITKLTGRLENLQEELAQYDEEQASVAREAQAAISASTQEAQSKINDLHGSFEKMIAKLEGVAEGSNAYAEMEAGDSTSEPTTEAPATESPDVSPLQKAMQDVDDDMPGEEDFDEIFGDAPQKETASTFDAPPVEETAEDEIALMPEPSEKPAQKKKRPPLTAKQKVILAARARRKRLERDAALDAETTAPQEDAQAEEPSAATAPEQHPNGAKEKISQLSQKYAPKDGSSKLPLIIGGALLLVIILGVFFLLTNNGSSVTSAIDGEEIMTVGPGGETSAGPAAPDTPELTAAEQYERWQTLAAAATSDEEKRRALIILKQSASRNHPPAQYALAEDYRTGRLGEQNDIMARSWYQEAAEGGNIAAMHKLGTYFALGTGGPANETTAVSWFEQAAAYGFVDSIYNLALIFDPTIDLDNGSTQEKNLEQAYYWYALAAKLGDPDANSEATRLGLLLQAEKRRELDAQVEGWIPRQAMSSAN